MGKWISIDDELPEDYEDVLMVRENLSMGVGFVMHCESYIRLGFSRESKSMDKWKIKVTHWMPLPDAPT